jgi:hypothetical protein
MFTKTKRAIALSLTLGFSGLGLAASMPTADDATAMTLARKGADDRPGDVKGEGAGHPVMQEQEILARRGRGKDDPAGDDRGVHAPGHPNQEETIVIARRGRGADDGAGHIRREDRRADRRRA